ncbi:TolC family protein [Legionella spiritensis]|uniref:TolC family protein n=1 Tax=Legionella spiritensis TaxID=452 RepID=UPI000F6B639A|nr:TolC family protein [Legionella spiritensis]VEG90893.1 Outer membrane efflux protein [Legionella spiritensis]
MVDNIFMDRKTQLPVVPSPKPQRSLFIRVVYGLLLLSIGQTIHGMPLTLEKAEREALLQAPETKSLQAAARAFEQSAIAAGQLADPKLLLGTLNVPVNTFSFNQEGMTQIQIGLQQSFPRGRSLHYQSLQNKDLSAAESHRQHTMRLQILQDVRIGWLNLYYGLRARQIVIAQKKIFRDLVRVTESLLANNKAQQKDVIRAQLELTELDNRLLDIEQQIEIARAALSRRIGPKYSRLASPQRLPDWSSPPSPGQLQEKIKQHPVLNTDKALILAEQAKVHLAKQQYKPGLVAGVAYGIRQGRDDEGRSRPDFLTAQVGVDLPLFTRNRQDRVLKASEENLLSIRENQISNYRRLCELLKQSYATWKQQQKSAQLYQRHLFSQAKQYAEATRTAYQNAQTDFPTLARAYIRELDTQLAGLKAEVNRDIARARLLYLQGR